jgi:peptide/nickel transport system substrate-binding protein
VSRDKHDDEWSSYLDPQLTRRSLLAAGIGGALVVAGCGSSSSGPTTAASSAAPSGAVKSGGTLRVGIAGGSPSDNFDAALVNGPSATTRMQVFYENLIWMDGNLELHNALADEISHNAKGDVWTVKLRQGLEFHNGQTVTADDVVFTINRIMNPKIGATASAQYATVLKKATKIDPLTVQFELARPVSFFPALLSDVTYIIPVGYDPKKPVSTGPWKMVSYSPGVETILERFPNYWGTPARADALHIVELPDDSARVNALLSSQVDAINQVPFDQIPALKGNSNFNLAISETGGFDPITMRVDVPPFNDARVRQAIRLVMNRQQAVESAYLGNGAVGADVMGRFGGCFGSFQREVDVEQAKSLLKQAGHQNLSVQLVATPQSAGIEQACQVLTQNATAAGINMSLRTVDESTYLNRYTQWPFSMDYWIGLPYMVLSTLTLGPGATVVNPTHFNDPEYNSLYYQASGMLDAGAQCDIIHRMQEIEYERGGFLIWAFADTVDAYSSKLGGYGIVDHTRWGLDRCRLDKVGLLA